MKILHLDSGSEMRGGQWQVLRLHQSLVEAGHHSLLLARASGQLLGIAAERGLPVEALRPVRLAALSREFDLIHAHDARTHTFVALLPKCPSVVSRRVAFPPGDTAASKWKYRQPRRFLAVSRFVAQTLIQAGSDASRVDVVYDGVDIPAHQAHGKAILTPFTEDPAKGMALAEEAAALAGVPLVRSTNLERDLPNAETMLYLTQSEGLGSGILLAMAHGVTVIASRVGGIPELIENGVNGILLQNEPVAVANTLRSLSPELCCRLGAAARETVRSRFTVHHMVQATLASYGKALND